MTRLRLTAAARKDLAEVGRYSIESFGGTVADAYLRGFKDAFARLRERPFAGAKRSEFGEGMRCLVHRRHRIFYRVDDELVLILRIIHHARNAHRELGR